MKHSVGFKGIEFQLTNTNSVYIEGNGVLVKSLLNKHLKRLVKPCRIMFNGNIIMPRDCSEMFKGNEFIKEIQFGPDMNFSMVQNMSSMFEDCVNLEAVVFHPTNLKSLEYIQRMFKNCYNLSICTFTDVLCNNLLDVSECFCGCEKLMELDLNGFGTQYCTNFSKQFYCCYMLQSLEYKSLDISNAWYCDKMFYDCISLKKISIDKPSVAYNMINSYAMFKYCNDKSVDRLLHTCCVLNEEEFVDASLIDYCLRTKVSTDYLISKYKDQASIECSTLTDIERTYIALVQNALLPFEKDAYAELYLVAIAESYNEVHASAMAAIKKYAHRSGISYQMCLNSFITYPIYTTLDIEDLVYMNLVDIDQVIDDNYTYKVLKELTKLV